MTTIADHIYYFMKKAGFKSQAELCRASNVPSSTMVRILKHGAIPNLDSLIAISEACRVTIDEIVKGKATKPILLNDVDLIYATREETKILTHFREANEMGKNLIRTACNNAPKSPLR